MPRYFVHTKPQRREQIVFARRAFTSKRHAYLHDSSFKALRAGFALPLRLRMLASGRLRPRANHIDVRTKAQRLTLQRCAMPTVLVLARATGWREEVVRLKRQRCAVASGKKMVLLGRIELPTSSLPMTRSTTELQQPVA
jgi:hypothetical protein